MAAVLMDIAAQSTPIDTGTLRGDLRASLEETLAQGEHPLGHGIMRILQTERTVPEIDALAHQLRDEQHVRRVALARRGIARGELRAHVDPDLVVDLVTAPVPRRAFTFGEAVDGRYIEEVLDVVLAGVEAKGARAATPALPARRKVAQAGGRARTR